MRYSIMMAALLAVLVSTDAAALKEQTLLQEVMDEINTVLQSTKDFCRDTENECGKIFVPDVIPEHHHDLHPAETIICRAANALRKIETKEKELNDMLINLAVTLISNSIGRHHRSVVCSMDDHANMIDLLLFLARLLNFSQTQHRILANKEKQ